MCRINATQEHILVVSFQHFKRFTSFPVVFFHFCGVIELGSSFFFLVKSAKFKSCVCGGGC